MRFRINIVFFVGCPTFFVRDILDPYFLQKFGFSAEPLGLIAQTDRRETLSGTVIARIFAFAIQFYDWNVKDGFLQYYQLIIVARSFSRVGIVEKIGMKHLFLDIYFLARFALVGPDPNVFSERRQAMGCN